MGAVGQGKARGIGGAGLRQKYGVGSMSLVWGVIFHLHIIQGSQTQSLAGCSVYRLSEYFGTEAHNLSY